MDEDARSWERKEYQNGLDATSWKKKGTYSKARERVEDTCDDTWATGAISVCSGEGRNDTCGISKLLLDLSLRPHARVLVMEALDAIEIGGTGKEYPNS